MKEEQVVDDTSIIVVYLDVPQPAHAAGEK